MRCFVLNIRRSETWKLELSAAPPGPGSVLMFLCLFGFSGTLWTFDPQTWTPPRPTAAAPPRSAFRATLRIRRRRRSLPRQRELRPGPSAATGDRTCGPAHLVSNTTHQDIRHPAHPPPSPASGLLHTPGRGFPSATPSAATGGSSHDRLRPLHLQGFPWRHGRPRRAGPGLHARTREPDRDPGEPSRGEPAVAQKRRSRVGVSLKGPPPIFK